MEPLENRALLAVDAFGGAASLVGSDVGESWGSDPAPAFSASELSTDAAETTISLAALNSVPYGPYVTSEQAALIALRSNATLADETLADFGVLWDETDETSETTLAETATDGETLNVVAEALTFEPLDLGEIEQEPGDASVMSGQTATSGGEIQVTFSGGMDNSFSGGLSFGTNKVLYENESFNMYFHGPANTSVTVNGSGSLTPSTWTASLANTASQSYTFTSGIPAVYEGLRTFSFSFTASDNAYTLKPSGVTVAVLDAPEFITGGAGEGEDRKTVNNDSYTLGFCVSEKVNNATVYTPRIHRAAGVKFEGTTSLPAPFFIDPSTGTITYDRNAQTDGQRFGTKNIVITAKYQGAEELHDKMTLTLKWADVAQAKQSLEVKWRECVNLLVNTTDITCHNVNVMLRNAFEQLERDDRNIDYAIDSITEEQVSSSCCLGVAPHSAIKITFVDGTVLRYDRGSVF